MTRTAKVEQPSGQTDRRFRILSMVTVAATFALVVLGGVVRVTGSGLGCPDWPLCHGGVVPTAEPSTLIEYSHRLVASLVGLLVLAVAVVCWRSYRNNRWLWWPALAALALVVAQGALGGLTVLSELGPNLVMAHLAMAEALLATVVLVHLVAARGAPRSSIGTSSQGRRPGLTLLTLVTALAAYGLLLSGSYTTVYGASAVCGSWPLCRGEWFPEGRLPLIHMAHRYAALAVGILVAITIVVAWRVRPRTYLAWLWLAAGGLFLTQALVGAANVWLNFSEGVRALHLALGSGVWALLAALVILPYMAARPSLRTAPRQARQLATSEGPPS